MLRTAAISTARDGGRTRVETTVAIALGASVQPLINSAASTNAKAAIRRKLPSGILEDYPLKNISDIFTSVSSIFQMLVQLAPFDYLTCITGTSFKQFSQGGMKHIISFILQSVNLHTLPYNPFELV